jgi:uncharacterized protein YndB with AHSA1/START domain
MSDTQGDIHREIFIAAAPEAVFDFFVDPALMARWIGLSHQLDPRPGGVFRVEVGPGNVALGVYKEVVRPHRVAFTWGWDAHDADHEELGLLPPGASLVEIELIPKDGGTLVRFRHGGLPEIVLDIHRERWSRYLARLETVGRPNGHQEVVPELPQVKEMK